MAYNSEVNTHIRSMVEHINECLINLDNILDHETEGHYDLKDSYLSMLNSIRKEMFDIYLKVR